MSTRDYVTDRESAKKAFESAAFDPANPRQSLLALHDHALARFDAEIRWYERHATDRQRHSRLIRGVAVLFASAAGILLTCGAFFEALRPLDVPLSAWAALLGAVAGAAMFYDRVFQVTEIYTRWRVMEYALRVARTRYHVDFLKAFASRPDEDITRGAFGEAQILAGEAYVTLMGSIKEETEQWQEGVEQGMALIKKRLDEISDRAKVDFKAANAQQDKDEEQQRQRQAELARQKVVLVVRAQGVVRPGGTSPVKLKLKVTDENDTVLADGLDMAVSHAIPIALTPALYVVTLSDGDGNVLDAKHKRLSPGKDDELIFSIASAGADTAPVTNGEPVKLSPACGDGGGKIHAR